jgi:lysophospholipase L1-like esterase
MRIFLILLTVVVISYAFGQFVRTRQYIKTGNGLAERAQAFSRELPDARMKILVIGDSTGVGTGASSPETSLAGLVGKKYPDASFVNRSVNGAKTGEAIGQLEQAGDDYDLILVHIGGNDNVHFTSYEKIRSDLRSLLDLAQKKGRHVLVTTTGNVGTVPLFPSPVRFIFGNRSRAIRKIFIEEVEKSSDGVRYVDLFREKENDPFAQ